MQPWVGSKNCKDVPGAQIYVSRTRCLRKSEQGRLWGLSVLAGSRVNGRGEATAEKGRLQRGRAPPAHLHHLLLPLLDAHKSLARSTF